MGGNGLTDAVLAEIGRALDAHELIKVRAGGLERSEREAALATICSRLGAEPVQHIGKIFVLYREKPPKESEPAEAPKPRKGKEPESATRSGRRGSRTA